MSVKKTLLVVDDNAINRKILCKILETAGYYTVEARNGQVAMDILSCGEPRISLMLLDIYMPVMNGYDVLHKMNENGLIKTTPVIITTGSVDSGDELRCLSEGASDFLTKPYTPDLVLNRINSILRLCDNAVLINKLEYDRITGAYSSEYFYEHINNIIGENKTDYYLVCADIENYKLINEKFGNETASELLRYVVQQLKRFADSDGICGRLGTDTFAVFCRKRSLVSQEELFAILNKECYKNSPVKNINLKFGIYCINDVNTSAEIMCDRALLALSTIKRQYGVCYAVYDDTLRYKIMREHQLSDYMEQSLNKKQFLVYLQPKHDVKTGKIAGAEALVRWVHPELGFVSPSEFIPLFERTGFITKLDSYMFEEVCKILSKWIKQGRPLFPISVNASRVDFLHRDLPQFVCELADNYEIPHEFLHCEVTESAYTDNPQQIVDTVLKLQSMGFKIEMDDFGSGYSSLNMLSELPIDILKLDMRFIKEKNAQGISNKNSILSFIISLSKWLQLPTVAEGVETEDEVEMLKNMGCDYIQGYFYAKPMPVDEFENYVIVQSEKVFAEVDTDRQIAKKFFSNPEKNELQTVLVVDDVQNNRDFLKQILEPYYSVITATNGDEAYRLIKEKNNDIYCVLLDLLMPVKDGFWVLGQMKEEGMLSKTPVIITSESGKDGELRALHLGAFGFAAKPFNTDILLHLVRMAVDACDYRKIKKALEEENKLLIHKAYIDELTSFFNRHGLKKSISRLDKDEQHTVIMMDIDNLKKVNDSYGHQSGDELIKSVAEVLRKDTRDGDVLARVGGDEFVIILRKLSDSEIAYNKVRRLCRTLFLQNITYGRHARPA